jgi:hypothetical protein
MSEPNTSALVHHDKRNMAYWYIPTDPPARSWRGPYPSLEYMRAAMRKELGGEPFENYTRIAPRNGADHGLYRVSARTGARGTTLSAR